MASLSAVIINVKSFPRRLMDTINAMPKRKRIVTIIGLIIFILLILFIIGYAIYLKATGNQIVNYATFTYNDESNIPRTIISNPVTIDILEAPTGNINITYYLQGIDPGVSESAILKFDVFQVGTKTAVIPEQTGSGSSTGTVSFPATLSNGNYDFCLKATSYLTKCLTNISYNSSTSPLALDFGKLLAGDFNDSNKVEAIDFSMLASHWMGSDPLYDLDRNTEVNSFDFVIFKTNWGKVGG